MRGIAATALNPVANAIIQLGTVPVLLHAWGTAKYGDWLMLSAVPSYLTLTNMGFGDASGSDMTLRASSGDKNGVIETFQSSLALLFGVSSIVLLAVISLVWLFPWQRSMHLASLSDRNAAQVVLSLAIYIVLAQQSGVIESGFRCNGHFAIGTSCSTLLRLGETVVASIVGVYTGNLLITAVTYLVFRCFATVAYALLLHRMTPWLPIGLSKASLERIKELAKPALGFMAMPLGYAISLQGFTLLIGSILGPIAVTAFSTLRTMTRVNFQLMTVIAWAIWPELSSAFGAGNLALARRLHRRAYQCGLALSIGSALSLWAAGPWIYRIWIHRAVTLNINCFHVLLAVTLLNSLWFTSSVVPMSTNSHHRLAAGFVTASSVSLALASVLVPRFGITGAACALLLVDAWMMWTVLRTSLRQLHDEFRPFVNALFQLPTSLTAKPVGQA